MPSLFTYISVNMSHASVMVTTKLSSKYVQSFITIVLKMVKVPKSGTNKAFTLYTKTIELGLF